jgi:3-oxoadipate enol-lactonase
VQTEVNGITLNYRDQGQGTPLLLVHAFPLSGAMWQPQIDVLSERFRVIAPDLRGFGESTVPPGPYAMEIFADDLAELLDALNVERVVLGGLSMGGYIAFAFWRKYAARVQALVLSDTRAHADTEEGKAGRENNAQIAEAQGAGAIADQMLPKLLATDASPELQAQVRSIIERNSPQGIAGALRGMALRPDATELLPQISVPTLFLVGTEDTLTTPEVMREMQTAVPDSRLVEIPGAAHVAGLENPGAFNTALSEFLRTL